MAENAWLLVVLALLWSGGIHRRTDMGAMEELGIETEWEPNDSISISEPETEPEPSPSPSVTPALPKSSVKLSSTQSQLIKDYAGASRYHEPLEREGLRGKSRNWGDAEDKIKIAVATKLINEGRKRGFSDEQIAAVLATTEVESGFNPDAAVAKTSSSAAGLTQITTSLLNHARKAGITDVKPEELFDADKHTKAFYDIWLGDTMKYASKLPGKTPLEKAANLYRIHYAGASYKGGALGGGGDKALRKFLAAYQKYAAALEADKKASLKEVAS